MSRLGLWSLEVGGEVGKKWEVEVGLGSWTHGPWALGYGYKIWGEVAGWVEFHVQDLDQMLRVSDVSQTLPIT